MKFIDGIVAPGVLCGTLSVCAGQLYFSDTNKKPRPISLTVGQLLFYSKLRGHELL